MKSYRKELWFNIPTRRAFVNITPQVEQCLHESGVKEGLALINAMTTQYLLFFQSPALDNTPLPACL